MKTYGRNIRFCSFAIASVLAIGGAEASSAGNLELAPFFQDGMVISERLGFTLTGSGVPGEIVTAKVPWAAKSGMIGEDGRFRLDFSRPFMKRGQVFALSVESGGERVVVSNCLAGIVLVAGGQSNMEVPIDETENWKDEVAKAERPTIREFKVSHELAFEPKHSLEGRWTPVTPSVARKIGAIGYFTAEYLQDALDGIPVGIVNNSWSATPIEPWLPYGFLHDDPRFDGSLNLFRKYRPLGPDGVIRKREELGRTFLVSDSENRGEKEGWHRAIGADWKDLAIPGWLETIWGDSADGAFWFAREVEIPEDLAGKKLEFRVGYIDDYDVTYFNGVEIGKTGEETPDSWEVPRAYAIPGELVKAGKNLISIRVFDTAHAGGLGGEKMVLASADGKEIDLKGIWKVKDEQIIKAKAWPPEFLELVKSYRWGSALYNSMVMPLDGTKADAILWYQGESNAGSAYYEELLHELIRVWRIRFGGGHVPFVIAQLAAYQAPPKSAADVGSWPITRSHQAACADKIAGVRLVPTIDIGDANRIHPMNKREVGRRNSLWLLQDVFAPEKFKGAIDLPRFAFVERVGDELIVSLNGAKGLKTTDGKPPRMFSFVTAIDAQTRKEECIWADAEIRGEKVAVKIPQGLNPLKLRYAWHMNPDVNLVNIQGMPATPFEVAVPEQ